MADKKRLVVLGNSLAAVKAIELIQASSLDFQITMFPLDSHLAVDRQLYTDQIIHQTMFKQMLYRPKEFYKENEINVVVDKTVSRVNAIRNRVHFKDRSQMEFDYLIVADTPDHRIETIKGAKKAGVFGFKKIQDVDQISTLAALNDNIAIESDKWWGISLALRLARKEKEIVLSVSSKNALLHGLDEETVNWLVNIFKEKNIRLLVDNPIIEILGESDIKAIKVESGKVFATDLTILDDTTLDLRVFSDGLEMMDDKFLVDENFKTNLDHVFVVDHAAYRTCEEGGSYGALAAGLEYQGELVAAKLLDKSKDIEVPLQRFMIEEHRMFLMSIGQVAERRGVTVSSKFIKELDLMVKLFEKDNSLIGMLAVNSGINPDNVVEQINSKSDLESYRNELFKALDDRLTRVQNYQSRVELQVESETQNAANDVQESDYPPAA